MKITCVKNSFIYKGINIIINIPITIGKEYEVLKKELNGPQVSTSGIITTEGLKYENGNIEFYTYEIINDEGQIRQIHQSFFDWHYIDEIREKKLNEILDQK